MTRAQEASIQALSPGEITGAGKLEVQSVPSIWGFWGFFLQTP